MARVDHKLVKRLLDEKRSKISDRQFFTSRVLALHFEDMAVAQTRRYKYDRRVRVRLTWSPSSDSVAHTDNLTIFINAGHSLVTQNRTRAGRYEIVSGLVAHELGHCLFTDFLSAQTHSNRLMSGLWHPEAPKLTRVEDIRNEQALWDYVKGEHGRMKAFGQISQYICNILEDGYIENRMLAQFPGVLGQNLSILRSQQWETVPTVTELKEREGEGGHILQSVLQLLLSYSKYGELKYGDEPLSDERIQLVFGLLPELDRAVTAASSRDRLEVLNLILVRCWKYIEDFIEKYPDDGDGTANQVSTALEVVAASSETGAGAEAPVEDGSDETIPIPSMTCCERAETAENAKAGEPQEQDADGGSPEREPARHPYRRTERVSVPEGGGIERNDGYEPTHNEDAAKAIERLLDTMAEKAACEQLENERLSELNEAAQGISYGDVHKGVSIRINRIAAVDEDMIEQYKAVAGPLLAISRQLQKSLTQQLHDRRRGGKQTGLMMGRRLDAHALCRNDGKVFYKNSLPSETPELAVALLLDESGSMHGERSDYARAAGMILYDFCSSLGIPVMVYGHSTEGSTVMLYSYAEFDSIDGSDRYRLMDVSARIQNRDGAALRYVAEQLAKRPEDVKLLILVSDGQPCDSGYYGSAAEEDLRGIKLEYRRRGIIFVAAAIGDDKPAIERIYGDSFLDITDLTQLPVKLTNIVKRHIRA